MYCPGVTCPAAPCPATGWRDCTAAETAVCADPADPPCTGELAACCPRPGFGGSHACCSESGDRCAHPPDPSGPCGSDRDGCCHVTNP